MSNTFINQMTIDYCRRREQSKPSLSKASKKDIQFYRKRVIPVSYTHLTLPTIYSV